MFLPLSNRQKPEQGSLKPGGKFKEIVKCLRKILIIWGLNSFYLFNIFLQYLISPVGLSAAILFYPCNIHLTVIIAVLFSFHTPPQTFFWQRELNIKRELISSQIEVLRKDIETAWYL